MQGNLYQHTQRSKILWAYKNIQHHTLVFTLFLAMQQEQNLALSGDRLLQIILSFSMAQKMFCL